MGRIVNEAKITTRNARSKLAQSKVPHWRAIDRGAHLGYRKGVNGGTWIVRWRKPDRSYGTQAIGKADDTLAADGEEVLDYSQALVGARQRIEDEFQGVVSSSFTVRDAIQEYLGWFAKHRKALYQVTRRAEVHILPALGDIPVSELTASQIKKWHQELADAPPRARSGKGRPINTRPVPTDPEGVRRRKATANKCLTILKATLNRAYQESDFQVTSDDAWRRAKPFRDVDAVRLRYLSTEEAIQLVNACEPNFRNLVRGALYTGCRYGELTSMEVADFNLETRNVLVRRSKSGKPRNIALTDEGVALFERLATGRRGNEIIFQRNDGEPWGTSHQSRPLARACAAANIDPPINFHGLRHCYGSWLALRGVPLQVIAKALGHADTRITERHYAHLSSDYVADTVRAHLPDLGVMEETNVVGIRHTK